MQARSGPTALTSGSRSCSLSQSSQTLSSRTAGRQWRIYDDSLSRARRLLSASSASRTLAFASASSKNERLYTSGRVGGHIQDRTRDGGCCLAMACGGKGQL